jgi:hypothetical protein
MSCIFFPLIPSFPDPMPGTGESRDPQQAARSGEALARLGGGSEVKATSEHKRRWSAVASYRVGSGLVDRWAGTWEECPGKPGP